MPAGGKPAFCMRIDPPDSAFSEYGKAPTQKQKDMKKLVWMTVLAVLTLSVSARELPEGPGKPGKPAKKEAKAEPDAWDRPLKMFRYQGELSLSYGIGLEWGNSVANLELINGIRFTPHVFAGVGIGGSVSFEESFYVPLFLDVKGYFPVGKRLDLTAGLDLGTRIDCYSSEGFGGLMLRPEFGINIRLGERYGLNLVLQYEYFNCRDYLYVNGIGYDYREKANKIGLKLGFSF